MTIGIPTKRIETRCSKCKNHKRKDDYCFFNCVGNGSAFEPMNPKKLKK